MLMRANPETTAGRNKLWIRFFLLAVFATMYVRDHKRHEFFESMGFDVEDYDRRVIRLTSEISRQTFPVSLDVDNPVFWDRLARVSRNTERMAEARQQGGFLNRVKAFGLLASNAWTLARLYCMPARRNELPADVRLQPVW